MTVKVLTDSTCDLPQEVAHGLGVQVIPLNVHFGDETYKDGVDLTAEAFYQRLTAAARLPTTSQPSVGEFLDLFQRLTEDGSPVVAVLISSKLSGTYNAALQARQQLEPARRVELVDTLQASLGLGLVAVAAARAALGGATVEEVVAEAQRASREVRFMGVLDTLEYLQRGGRIGKAQAFLGSLLRIKPILYVKDGEAHPLERVRTQERAVARLVELVRELAPLQAAGVVYTTTPEEALALRQRVEEVAPAEGVIVGRCGPVIGTYLGPGALGVAVRSQKVPAAP